jgi:hypothetical protein
MARRYILPGDRPIAPIERDINHGRDGENVPARQKRHDDTREAKGAAGADATALGACGNQ